MTALVQVSQRAGITHLTLNRPERHNSLVPALLDELLQALRRAEVEAQSPVIVLQAKGASFSTGGDLAGFRDHLDTIGDYADEIVGRLNQVILTMLNLEKPVVTAVQGLVTGGSMGLVLASDVVLVAPQASFRPYYSRVGFSPDGGWTALLPAIIGVRRTAEVLMANRAISAQKAVDWGIANSLVPAERLHQQAVELAQELAAMQAGSLKRTKCLLNQQFHQAEQRLAAERINFVEQISLQETQASMLAFHDQMKGS